MLRHIILTHVIITLFISCSVGDPIPTSSTGSNTLAPGDIVVGNNNNDSVIALNPDGSFKSVLYDVENSSESIYGVAWNAATNEVLVTVDGSDRIVAISAVDGTVTQLVTNSNFSGNPRGLTALTNGDIVAIEGDTAEKFSSDGVRIVTGSFPISGFSSASDVASLAAGGFILAMFGTDRVYSYNADGTRLAGNPEASPPDGATTDAYGCIEMSNGKIAVVWSGTNDQVVVYDDSDFTNPTQLYINLAILSTPKGIAQRANGNLLILDSNYHHIVEITSSGDFVAMIGGSVLSGPRTLTVIPDY